MKYCTSYRQIAAHADDVSQFRFTASTLGLALEFLEAHPEGTAIIEILDLESSKLSTSKIHNLIKENDRLYFDFYSWSDFVTVAKEAPKRRCFMHYPCVTYGEIYFIMHMVGTAGITITEPLIFDIPTVRSVVDSYAANDDEHFIIRMVPYIGRPTLYDAIKEQDKGLCHFWVLPQHIHLYEEYIDYVDILAKEQTFEATLLNVYLQGSYLMPLHTIFANVDTLMTGNFVDEDWAKKRLNCRQTCMMNGHRACHYCDQQNQMYLLLKERHQANH